MIKEEKATLGDKKEEDMSIEEFAARCAGLPVLASGRSRGCSISPRWPEPQCSVQAACPTLDGLCS